MGTHEYGVDPTTLAAIAREVAAVHGSGTELAIVVGGGNFYRGIAAAADGMDRATADYAGMLATLLNALALQDGLERLGAADAGAVGNRSLPRSPSRTSAAAPCGISKRGEWSSSPRAPATRSSRPIPPLRCGHCAIGAEAILMAKNGVQGSTMVIRARIRRPRILAASPRHLKAIDRGLFVMDTIALFLCMDNQFRSTLRTRRGKHHLRRVGRADRNDRVDAEGGRWERSRTSSPIARCGWTSRSKMTRTEFLSAHRACLGGIARPHHDRLRRPADAAEQHGNDLRAGSPPALDPAVRRDTDQSDREGDPGVGSRVDAVERRQTDPTADPAADGGAPEGAREGGAALRARRARSRSETCGAT